MTLPAAAGAPSESTHIYLEAKRWTLQSFHRPVKLTAMDFSFAVEMCQDIRCRDIKYYWMWRLHL